MAEHDRLVAAIIQQVAELPDRTSPDDWPEAMIVTAPELAAILSDLSKALAAAEQRIKALEAANRVLRIALGALVGLYDAPTPYDSATTIAAARAALRVAKGSDV